MVHSAYSKSEKVKIRVAQILKALSTTTINSKKTADLIISIDASYKEKSQKGDSNKAVAFSRRYESTKHVIREGF